MRLYIWVILYIIQQLDEPTTALDPIAEYDIYTLFNDFVNEKIAIYISHRLSSCKFCDRIFSIFSLKFSYFYLIFYFFSFSEIQYNLTNLPFL